MFEKCGLRDIFVRIGRMKWLILALILIGAAVGSILYVKDINAASSEEHEMYCGYAYYYLYTDIYGNETSASKHRTLSDTYIDGFSNNSTSEAIYDALLEKYNKKELGELLDKDYYSGKTVRANNIYRKVYGLTASQNKTILTIRVKAETPKVRNQLLGICRKQLKLLSEKIPDSRLHFIGKYTKKTDINEHPLFEKTEEEEKEEEEKTGPSVTTIIVFALLGLAAGLIIAIASAVFSPSVNRGPDFDLYEVKALGTAFDKSSDGKVPAKLIGLLAEEKGAERIVIVSTLSKDKQIDQFAGKLISSLAEENRKAVFAPQPDLNSGSNDECLDAGLIVCLERRGVTRHHSFDNMNHHLGILNKTIDGAVLIR